MQNDCIPFGNDFILCAKHTPSFFILHSAFSISVTGTGLRIDKAICLWYNDPDNLITHCVAPPARNRMC